MFLGDTMTFSGDASGSGVWIWGAEELAHFKHGMASLMGCIASISFRIEMGQHYICVPIGKISL